MSIEELNARWYCVSKDGAATLCVDEEDARKTAADADLDYPRNAPHTATQLAPISALEVAEKARRTISQADVSKAARFICDRSAKEMGIDGDDNWKLYGSEYIEDTADMLKHIGFAIAATAKGA